MVPHASLFSQLLFLFPRVKFERAVLAHKAERYAKGFSCWAQFVSMLFCQLAQAHSLREICGGLKCCLGKLVHLGVREAPNKSTLAYANEHRPWELYQTVFEQMLGKCHEESCGKKKKFRFRNKLYSLDATTIDLCLKVFPWAKFLHTKGAVKLHLLLDHDGYLPEYACLTDGKVHDVKVAKTLSFAPGSLVVMDRAYVDYALFHRWDGEGTFFVTRQKGNAAYRVVERESCKGMKNIRCDQKIRMTGNQTKKKYPGELRRVVVWDEVNRQRIVLLTNNFALSARTIAAIYKDRWEIEIFFKTLKQNLKVKTFVGTSENALRIQIWTALIAILLLKYLKFKSTLSWAMSHLVAF